MLGGRATLSLDEYPVVAFGKIEHHRLDAARDKVANEAVNRNAAPEIMTPVWPVAAKTDERPRRWAARSSSMQAVILPTLQSLPQNETTWLPARCGVASRMRIAR